MEAIKDPTKRARAEELAKAFDRQQISAFNERGELTNEEEDFFVGCGFGIFDGEDENNPLEELIEVAGAGFDLGDGFASSRFSVLILSKRCTGQAAYRLQGPSPVFLTLSFIRHRIFFGCHILFGCGVAVEGSLADTQRFADVADRQGGVCPQRSGQGKLLGIHRRLAPPLLPPRPCRF